MVDVHCHILPGLDDGPDNIEVSLAMAESAIADGITHVVATPHSSNEYHFDYSRIRALRDELQGKIGSGLLLATGCDFHLNPENLAALREDSPRFCINQHDYLLVEFNEFSIPPHGPDASRDSTSGAKAGDYSSRAQRHPETQTNELRNGFGSVAVCRSRPARCSESLALGQKKMHCAG